MTPTDYRALGSLQLPRIALPAFPASLPSSDDFVDSAAYAASFNAITVQPEIDPRGQSLAVAVAAQQRTAEQVSSSTLDTTESYAATARQLAGRLHVGEPPPWSRESVPGSLAEAVRLRLRRAVRDDGLLLLERVAAEHAAWFVAYYLWSWLVCPLTPELLGYCSRRAGFVGWLTDALGARRVCRRPSEWGEDVVVGVLPRILGLIADLVDDDVVRRRLGHEGVGNSWVVTYAPEYPRQHNQMPPFLLVNRSRSALRSVFV